MRALFKECSEVRERLIEILGNEINTLHDELEKNDTFKLPAWSEYQACKVGEIRAYRSLINLLKEE